MLTSTAASRGASGEHAAEKEATFRRAWLVQSHQAQMPAALQRGFDLNFLSVRCSPFQEYDPWRAWLVSLWYAFVVCRYADLSLALCHGLGAAQRASQYQGSIAEAKAEWGGQVGDRLLDGFERRCETVLGETANES